MMLPVQRLLHRLGPAGVAGIVLPVLCAAFYVAALEPAERALERRAALAQRAPHRAAPVAVDPAAEFDRWRALFPPAGMLSAELQQLHAHAAAARLRLREGQYRLEPQPNGLTAYHISLPVHGSYAQLRQFIGRVLTHMPHASLDALRFERKNGADEELQAEIRLTIHLRPAAAGKGT